MILSTHCVSWEQYVKLPSKVKVLCYLGGLLTAFDLVYTGLSQSDPVSDGLQLAAVLLHTVRHPGRNTHTHVDMKKGHTHIHTQRKVCLRP